MWFNIILILILVGVFVYVIARRRGIISTPASSAGDVNMSASQRRTIIGYLLTLGLLFVFLEVSLLSVDFPVTAPVVPVPTPPPAPVEKPATPANNAAANDQANPPAANGQANQAPVSKTPAETTTYPKIHYVLPESTISTTPNMSVIVYGSNFPSDSRVRLNGAPVTPDALGNNLLKASVPPDLLGGKGTLTVDVVGADNHASNAVILSIDKPLGQLSFIRWSTMINRELQLLLLVVFAGALGSLIHITKSATAYIGNGNMKASWFWWYLTGPLVGMAMALIFYAVLRGGFLVGTPADEKFVNPFGVVVVGALVGMFSDKASLKLGEIFDTLFKSSADPRGDRLDEVPAETAAPTITAPDTLPDAAVGTVYDQTFNATGGTQPYAWSITSGNLPGGLTLADPATGRLTGTPTETGTFQFTVNVADANSHSAEKSYELTVS